MCPVHQSGIHFMPKKVEYKFPKRVKCGGFWLSVKRYKFNDDEAHLGGFYFTENRSHDSIKSLKIIC